jgi:hypothetical protein
VTALTSQLAAMKARLEAATPGPWFKGGWSGQCHMRHMHASNDGPCHYEYTKNSYPGHVSSGDESDPNEHVITTEEYGQMSDDDAEFIAHAPTDIRRLIAMLEKAIEQRNQFMTDVVTFPNGAVSLREAEIANADAELALIGNQK